MSRSASASERRRWPVVVVGDSFLDRDLCGAVERLAPDAPVPVVRSPEDVSRPGGAALAAALLAGGGRPVVLVTALAVDAAGAELAGLLERHGVEVAALALHGSTPQKVRVRGGGHLLVRLDLADGAAPLGELPAAARRAIAGAGAVLVSDYGRGMAAAAGVRDALVARSQVPVVWDPHPRGPAPPPGVRVVTPNSAEVATFTAGPGGEASTGGDLPATTERARALLRRWRPGGVAVTLGARGALLVTPGANPLVAPPPDRLADGVDTCGAGDRFAGEVTALLGDGALLSEAVVGAVEAASAFIAAGGVSALPGGGLLELPVPRPADRLAARVRSRGGTVVATGGCFDLLHAGHVELLRAARALGDCLIVCVNSDASVRRLKGEGRPVVPEADRAAVLRALDAVDAVALFDEDTPERLLERLRPDLWVKGADYAASDLPESALLATWGGQAVVLPYRPGRSTSGLIAQIRADGAAGAAPGGHERHVRRAGGRRR